MKKGRKPKGKKKLQELEKENNRKRNYSDIIKENELDDDMSKRKINILNKHKNANTIDSENASLDERSEIKYNQNKKSERSSIDGNSVCHNQGPITRRKENQILQINGKNNFEKAVSELNTLQKFDDYYKEKKNVEHEMYFYHPPRISRDLYQVSIENFDNNSYNSLINKSENKKENESHFLDLLIKDKLFFDHSKILKDDLNYYLKFVSYYKDNSSSSISSNIFLKGVHSFETNALNLLKNCNYEINLALRKILFPVLDLLSDDENENEKKYPTQDEPPKNPKSSLIANNYKKYGEVNNSISSLTNLPHYSNQTKTEFIQDPMIFVNSALNDLIGSNIQEKEEWLTYVKNRIDCGIDYNELQILIELGSKMKIDIPDFVIVETENSLSFARGVRRHLSEKNSLDDLINLLKISQNYKVKTEEFIQLEETIKKANNWASKVQEYENKTINFKALQCIYQEGKNLAVKLNKFDEIKSRYFNSQKWQEKFQNLPKHSKTRQHGNISKRLTTERCNLKYLEELIKESEEINFTSNDVISLKTNYDKLVEAENRIQMTLDDSKIAKSKDLLNEFINTLDSLKFATPLYDVVASKLEYFNWEEKKNYYMGNKVLKMKHLRNLIIEAEQKNLNYLQDIQNFKSIYEKIEKWLKTMGDIFYNDEDPEEVEEPENCEDVSINLDENQYNSDNSQPTKKKNKIEIEEFKKLYEAGKSFEYKPEEVSRLLLKSEEFFEFTNECKSVNEKSNDESSQLLEDNSVKQYLKLNALVLRSLNYNIKCEECELLEKQIQLMKDWIEKYLKFQENQKCINEQFVFQFPELNSLENRQMGVGMLENYLDYNQNFHESLVNLISSTPKYLKLSKEYVDLQKYKDIAEDFMRFTFFQSPDLVVDKINFRYKPADMNLKELEEFLINSHVFPIKKEYFTKLLCIYRAKSWVHIASLKKKMSLSEAESMIKEASNLNLNSIEVVNIKNQITKTKEWVKRSKKISNSGEKIHFNHFKKFINDGTELPLIPNELDDFFQYQDKLEDEIFQANSFLQNQQSFDNLIEFSYKINNNIIEVAEFEIILQLKEVCEELRRVAIKILETRKWCQLYFKQDYEKIAKKRKLSQDLLSNNEYICESKISEDNESDSHNELNAVNNLHNNNLSDQFNHSTMNKNLKIKMPKILNPSSIKSTPVKKRKINKIFQQNMNTISSNDDVSFVASVAIIQNTTTEIFPAKNNMHYLKSSLKEPMIERETDIISKKKLKKASKKEYENVLQIINNTSHNNSHSQYFNKEKILKPLKKEHIDNSFIRKVQGQSNYLDSYLQINSDKMNLKKFDRFNLEDKLNIISQSIVLRDENPTEKYCICRRGDDGLNLMTMCEYCKEWFHINCMKINKNIIDKICLYMCICCTRRKDIPIQPHHFDFFDPPRIPFEKFIYLIKESDKLPILFDESENLKLIYENVINWIERYNSLLEEILDFLINTPDNLLNFYNSNTVPNFSSNNNKIKFLNYNNTYTFNDSPNYCTKSIQIIPKILDEKLEKKLYDLYLESEGFPIDMSYSTNIINILKQNDWFKDTYKCLENKKFSEKINKKVLQNSFIIFNKDFLILSSSSEEKYFGFILEKALKILSQIYYNYEKYTSIIFYFKEKYEKKYFDIFEELIPQIDNHGTKSIQNIIEELDKYIEWILSVNQILQNPEFFDKEINKILDKAKSFNFKSSFLEKFRRISINPIKEQCDYYKSFLFGDTNLKEMKSKFKIESKSKGFRNYQKKKNKIIKNTDPQLDVDEKSIDNI